jgi:hypothetical protein
MYVGATPPSASSTSESAFPTLPNRTSSGYSTAAAAHGACGQPQWRLVADRFVRGPRQGIEILSPADVNKRCRDKDAAAPNQRDIASGATVEFKSTSACSHRRREKFVTNP